MSILSTRTKGKLAVKGAQNVAKRPELLRAGAIIAKPAAALGITAGRPLAKKAAKRRTERVAETARTWGQALTTFGPPAARELGLVETEASRHTARDLAAGALIGATAVYFLEPERGEEHRQKVRQLVPGA